MLQTQKYSKTFSDLYFCNKFIFVQNSPQLIVGFQSRVHTYDRIFRRYGVTDPRHRYLRTSKENHQYSYIITNVCFVHIHYLHMYTYELPRRFYNFVELHNNCEDIFLAGMVGEFLRKSGRAQPCCIWVEGHGEHLEKVASMYYNCTIYILYKTKSVLTTTL